jgi:hypothetical protein
VHSLLRVCVFVVDEPIDGGLQIFLHISLLLVSELQYKVGVVVVVLDVQFYLLENLALDVLSYLLLLVPSSLEPFV